MEDEKHYSKEAIETDLALIKSCLKLINQTIAHGIDNGEAYDLESNENIHRNIAKIDYVLTSIKNKINY